MNMNTLTELFNEYNGKYFNNVVKCSLHFYSRRSRTCGFYRVRFLTNSININSNATDQDMKQTLLHEMIHAYLHQTKQKWGHTPTFKRMMRDLTQRAFNFRPTTNVRFHFSIPTSPIPTPAPIVKVAPAPMPVTPKGNVYKVLSTGKIGTFLRESVIYGKKHIVLQIDGAMFPFTTSIDNIAVIS